MKLTKGQEIALNYHLTEYPDAAEYKTILMMIERGGELIKIWAPFMLCERRELIMAIKSLAAVIDKAIDEASDNWMKS